MGEMTDEDGVVHRVERVTDTDRIDTIRSAIASAPVVIADIDAAKGQRDSAGCRTELLSEFHPWILVAIMPFGCCNTPVETRPRGADRARDGVRMEGERRYSEKKERHAAGRG